MREQNQSLKCCQPFELLHTYSEMGLRFFNTGNVGSADQRAKKLPSIKLAHTLAEMAEAADFLWDLQL